MWRTVLRLEWRILSRDRAALAVLGLFAVFLILAAAAGGRQTSSLAEGLSRAADAESARLDGLRTQLKELESGSAPLSAKDPRDPVWMGQQGSARLITLPPSPLAPVAVGQRDLHPQAVRVTTGVHLTSEHETESSMAGPTRLRTGAFDPAFLFVVLFPLVVVALSYEILSGERERGTLAMLLSQPVTQLSLVLGKACARAIALCTVTLVFALLGLFVAGAELGQAGAWSQVGFYALVLVAWALFWLSASIAVNAWGPSSARNALFLVGMWLVLVVVVPGLVHVAVDSLYPPPSRIEVLHEAREAAQKVEGELNALVGRHDVDLKSKGYAKRVVEVQEELARRSSPVLVELREKLQKRQQMLGTLRFLSPAIVVQLALEDVAGSGSLRHQRFEEQVDAYHKSFRAFFFERIRSGKAFNTASLESLPQFSFVEESSGALMWRVLSGVLGLLLGALVLILIALPGLRRVGRLAR